MIQKGLAAAVILLFVGTSIIPSISTAIEDKSCIATINDGNLSGYVHDTNMNPIEEVLVRVYFHGEYEEDYTDSSGFYHVTNIPICYCLKNATASKVGYETEWILLSITENTTHDFVLTPLVPVPDLDCDGSLCWTEVTPGETVTGSFTVENIGDEGSLLDWEIESYPDWGTWTFDPDSGTGLKPEYGPVTVDVEVVWPDEADGGEIKMVNCENPDDFCIIDICIPPPPPPPPSFGITYIGKIRNLEFHNESISFHTDFVIILFLVLPIGISVNEDITLENNYKGFVGKRFIFALFWI